MSRVVLALGSNLGDRAANLRRAVEMLASRGVRVTALSSIWETPPVPADQPAFLNAALAATTEIGPEALLAVAKAIEWELGRRPSRRWGPRPIDIDILFYDAIEQRTELLTIPHPLIAERAFVLVPLAEVMPGVLPGLNATAAALLAPLDQAGIVRVEETLRSH